jgi:Flp pilus assembly protein TadD
MSDGDDFNSFAEQLGQEGGFASRLGLEKSDLRHGLDIAAAHRQKGELGEALKVYSALVLLDLTEPDYQLGLADCAYAMGQYELCIQAASALIAMRPAAPEGYYLSGAACLALGQSAEASEDLMDAMRLAKEHRNAVIYQQAERLLSALEAGRG